MKYNLNDTIRFRINPGGADLYVKHFRDIGMEPPPISSYFHTDYEGWSETQFWVFCNIFGPGMGNGFDPPVETEIELREAFTPRALEVIPTRS